MGTAFLLFLQSMRVDSLVQVAALVSALGRHGFIWIVVAIVFAFSAEKRETAACVAVSLVISLVVCCLILEPLVGRVRPCDAGIGVSAVMGVSKAGYSFPSDIAFLSFAAIGSILQYRGVRKTAPFLVLGILVSTAGLYLGVNYVSDVLAGIVFGLVVSFLAKWLLDAFLLEYLRSLARRIGARFGGALPTRKTAQPSAAGSPSGAKGSVRNKARERRSATQHIERGNRR